MIDLNEKSHTSVVIGSLDKIYKQVRMTGKLHATDIYILESIYKLLSGCESSITHYQRRTLLSLYNRVLNTSKYTCQPVILDIYKVEPKSKFVQAEFLDCNNYPNNSKIYYWQEYDYTISNTDLLIDALEPGFTNNKLSTTATVFETGKEIDYTSIGVIGFLINDTVIEDVYKVYDVNNFDITSSFIITFLPEINSTLIVSTAVYSYGALTFKIKKI